MNKGTPNNHKPNALAWAKQEFQNDKEYWQDRAEHGSGFIQEVANFILQFGK